MFKPIGKIYFIMNQIITILTIMELKLLHIYKWGNVGNKKCLT